MESDLENTPGELKDRLQETEIKMAFMERELEEYKEAVGLLHDRLARLEKQVRELRDGEESSRNIGEFWKPEEP